MSDETKICPQCAETIKQAAVICRYCGASQTDPFAPSPAVGSKQAIIWSSAIAGTLLVLTFVQPLSGFLKPMSPPIEAAEVEPEQGRAVLVPAGLDIVPELRKAGAPWDVEPFDDSSNYTGGTVDLSRRTVSFPMGSISIDRPASGGIYMVIIRSGMGDRCGDASALGRAYAALLGPLEMPLPSESQVSELQKAWSTGNGFAEIQFPNGIVRASGGCVSSVVIKATP